MWELSDSESAPINNQNNLHKLLAQPVGRVTHRNSATAHTVYTNVSCWHPPCIDWLWDLVQNDCWLSWFVFHTVWPWKMYVSCWSVLVHVTIETSSPQTHITHQAREQRSKDYSLDVSDRILRAEFNRDLASSTLTFKLPHNVWLVRLCHLFFSRLCRFS